MAIRLTPDQIPQFWEHIKWAVVNSGQISEKHFGSYFNRLLYQLLSSKAQCFVSLSDDRHLKALAIVKFTTDESTGDKSLYLSTLYAFVKSPTSEWIDNFENIKKLARKEGCKTIHGIVNHDKVFGLAMSLGFKKTYDVISYDIGGER